MTNTEATRLAPLIAALRLEVEALHPGDRLVVFTTVRADYCTLCGEAQAVCDCPPPALLRGVCSVEGN